jgi:effector-binding domain-containing protein
LNEETSAGGIISCREEVMKLIASVLGVLIILIVVTLSYYGLFSGISIAEKEMGGFWLLYEKHIGDYKEVGQVMDKMYARLLGEDAIEATRGFGLYYDDPKKVKKENLRSVVGCILDKQDENRIDYLKKNYKIKYYPASKSVVAEFPFKGTLSIFLGIFKVYPRLAEYITQHNYPPGPIMEIYDTPNETIFYVASIAMDAGIFDSFLE